jgi:hypothetical protein
MLNIKIYLFYTGEVDLTITDLKSSTVESAQPIYGFNFTIWGGADEKKGKKKEEEVECSILLLDGASVVSCSGHLTRGEWDHGIHC